MFTTYFVHPRLYVWLMVAQIALTGLAPLMVSWLLWATDWLPVVVFVVSAMLIVAGIDVLLTLFVRRCNGMFQNNYFYTEFVWLTGGLLLCAALISQVYELPVSLIFLLLMTCFVLVINGMLVIEEKHSLRSFKIYITHNLLLISMLYAVATAAAITSFLPSNAWHIFVPFFLFGIVGGKIAFTHHHRKSKKQAPLIVVV